MGARLDGRTNASELLINIVNLNEPKMLIGSGQNGTWQVNSPVGRDYTDMHATGE